MTLTGILTKKPKTKTSPVRNKIPTEQLLVATGTHKNSTIALYDTNFEEQPVAAVFIYPSNVKVDSNNIPFLDGGYDSISVEKIKKTLTDRSVEEVSDDLLGEASFPSIYDFRYTSNKEEILVHHFNHNLMGFLEDIIKDM